MPDAPKGYELERGQCPNLVLLLLLFLVVLVLVLAVLVLVVLVLVLLVVPVRVLVVVSGPGDVAGDVLFLSLNQHNEKNMTYTWTETLRATSFASESGGQKFLSFL